MNTPSQLQGMPAVLVSHGSPMVAILSGPYQEALADFGGKVRPKAIVAISAHWGSRTTIGITASDRHGTIHNFRGFPRALYELTYDAPGSPQLASRVAELLDGNGWSTTLTKERGLDHGVWVPLRLMYPAADVPVVALSTPLQLSPEELYRVGLALAPLRDEEVLIFGSGGVVHNLGLVHFANARHPVDAWAAEFDAWFADVVEHKKFTQLFDYKQVAPHASLAVPTFEHFAPVFVVLGAGSPRGGVTTIYEGFEHGNISMRSFAIA